jgi:ABC-type Fe3+-siderophore transport system permease subunit
LTPAVFIGLIGAFVARAIAGAGKPEIFGDGAGVLSIITLVVAVIVSLIFEVIAKKFKLTWLEPFVMPIGMIVAMVVAVVAFNVLPADIAILEWRG